MESAAPDPRLLRIVAAQPYPLVFATISGAHLYGFPSPDSDYDLRGVHVLPLREVLGLEVGHQTIECERIIEGLEMDIVSHDLRKFLGLLLKPNGYVLEQLLSPLVVHTTPEHFELKTLAEGCLTRHHAHHYLGFAQTQWRLFEKESHRRIKPLLYVYRVLLTGIHLMRSGRLEACLPRLLEHLPLPQVPELIALKTSGAEQQTLSETDFSLHEREYQRLLADLEAARDASTLRESPTPAARAGLNDLLVRVRLQA
ncbi:MAG: nucleotidyltransferase domain-containing protein [Verrucomicrobia bacterium]|nr:nucleotidyltransferase domain-containing protein [Verrucomicrobiota bacterium]